MWNIVTFPLGLCLKAASSKTLELAMVVGVILIKVTPLPYHYVQQRTGFLSHTLTIPTSL